MGAVTNGRGRKNRVAGCLAIVPDKQRVALIAIESLGQRTCHLKKALDMGLSVEALRMANDGVPTMAYVKIHQMLLRRSVVNRTE